MLLTQRRKAAPNASASIVAKTRPKVSCEGMPCASRRYRLNQSCFSLAHSSISTKSSAPASTPHTAITSSSTRSWSTFLACRGSRIPTNTSATRSLPSVSMDLSKKTENYTTHETVNSPPSNSLNVNDYFQGFTTLAFMRLPWRKTATPAEPFQPPSGAHHSGPCLKESAPLPPRAIRCRCQGHSRQCSAHGQERNRRSSCREIRPPR